MIRGYKPKHKVLHRLFCIACHFHEKVTENHRQVLNHMCNKNLKFSENMTVSLSKSVKWSGSVIKKDGVKMYPCLLEGLINGYQSEKWE